MNSIRMFYYSPLIKLPNAYFALFRNSAGVAAGTAIITVSARLRVGSDSRGRISEMDTLQNVEGHVWPLQSRNDGGV
jgi:hypothetical protein